MSILRVAESFKTMSRPNPTVTLFNDLFLGMFNKHLKHFIIILTVYILNITRIRLWIFFDKKLHRMLAKDAPINIFIIRIRFRT